MSARVLVVDDDPIVAEVVVDYLREAGLEPRHVADGPAALALSPGGQDIYVVSPFDDAVAAFAAG